MSAAGAKRGTRERRGVVDPGAAPQRRCVVDALAEDLGLDSGEGGLEAEPAEDLATLAEDVENGAGVVPGQEGLEGIGDRDLEQADVGEGPGGVRVAGGVHLPHGPGRVFGGDDDVGGAGLLRFAGEGFEAGEGVGVVAKDDGPEARGEAVAKRVPPRKRARRRSEGRRIGPFNMGAVREAYFTSTARRRPRESSTAPKLMRLGLPDSPNMR